MPDHGSRAESSGLVKRVRRQNQSPRTYIPVGASQDAIIARQAVCLARAPSPGRLERVQPRSQRRITSHRQGESTLRTFALLIVDWAV